MSVEESIALYEKGINNMSDVKLLASIIGTTEEIASEIWQEAGTSFSILARWCFTDFMRFQIGREKAIRITAAFELSRRKTRAETEKPYKITCSKDTSDYLAPYFEDQSVEYFYVLYVRNNNTVIALKKLSQGGTAGTVVDPKLVFKYAFQCSAHAIILAHNHPSGNLNPSEADLSLTKRLVRGGKELGIEVFDHLIFAGDKYTSLADEQYI